MAETLTKVRETVDTVILEPSKYKVIVYNDNSTPVDFVVAMLMSIFHHSQEVSEEITLKVHNEGFGVAGIYTYEIAEQKVVESTGLARKNGFPLIIKAEAE